MSLSRYIWRGPLCCLLLDLPHPALHPRHRCQRCWFRWHQRVRESWRTTAGHSTTQDVAAVLPGRSCLLWSVPYAMSSIPWGPPLALTVRDRTDHSALHWLMSFREPEGQLTHWIEELQAYDFTVIHRPGACHGNAGALSCCPCNTDGWQHCEEREAQEAKSRQPQPYVLSRPPPAMSWQLWMWRGASASTKRMLTSDQCSHGWLCNTDQHGKRLPCCLEPQKGSGHCLKICMCDGVLQRGWKELVLLD